MARYLSDNPAAAQTERLYLWYSPVWMLAVGLVQLGGIMDTWGDLTFMAFGMATALPLFVWPMLKPHPSEAHKPWWDRYWLRLNIWVGALVWVGSYFGTHYFFQALGMTYAFKITWTLQATIAGSDAASVPLFLYPVTQAYFITYHVVMMALYRRFRHAFEARWARVLFVLVISYTIAFAETFAMANPLLAKYFQYADRAWMLRVGSTAYALYFVVSLPMVARLNDRGTSWPLFRVLIEGLGTAMIIMTLLDFWTWLAR